MFAEYGAFGRSYMKVRTGAPNLRGDPGDLADVYQGRRCWIRDSNVHLGQGSQAIDKVFRRTIIEVGLLSVRGDPSTIQRLPVFLQIWPITCHPQLGQPRTEKGRGGPR